MTVEPGLHNPNADMRRGLGLLVATLVVAYPLSALLMFAPLTLYAEPGALLGQGLTGLLSLVLSAAPIGLSLAVFVTFAIGLPAWPIALRRGPVTLLRAAKYGALAGAIIGGVETAVAIVFSVSGSHYPWLKHAIDSLGTMGIGAITGCVAALVAGFGRKPVAGGPA